jgi:hypothetical protein
LWLVNSIRSGGRWLARIQGSGFRKESVTFVESVGARVARPKEGMRFWSRNDHGKIVNYPKLHYKDGVRKNSPERTNGWYKPRARIFKNARTYLVDQGTISDDLAPSYFLECPL